MTHPSDSAIIKLNALSDDDFVNEMIKCCHCKRLATDMLAQRPFATVDEVLEAVSSFFMSYGEEEFLEAFQGHPRIGEEALKEKFGASAELSTNEQAAAKDADPAVISELSKMNDQYFDRFGFIFIVCATGKSAQEMLELLMSRINNERVDELLNAAGEQDKITKIRLSNLFDKLREEEARL